MIGHTGIATAKGIIHDFAGPYTISVDDFSFGECYKYVRLNVTNEQVEEYNQCIEKADKTYSKRMHNICCDNCHSHVACALNNLKY